MFAKRGIAFKLGLGFALLIVFTVAVAGVGYRGLSDLLTRSAKMDAVGDISDAITNARMDMLYFINSKDLGRKESFSKSLVKGARERAKSQTHAGDCAIANAWMPLSPPPPLTRPD
jgi:methyl-accepting chemotaxis protein